MFVVTLSNFSQQNKADVHTARGVLCMDCRSCGSKYPYFGAASLEFPRNLCDRTARARIICCYPCTCEKRRKT